VSGVSVAGHYGSLIMRNFERILALAAVVVGAIGIWAASGLSLWMDYSVGPGAAPIAYGAGVIVCGAAMLVKPTNSGTLDLGPFFARAALLILMMAALTVAIEYIGFTGGFLVFSVAALIFISRLKPFAAIVFAAIWVAVLYGVFVYLLHIPFPRGTLL
jgi:hypothetical protein